MLHRSSEHEIIQYDVRAPANGITMNSPTFGMRSCVVFVLTLHVILQLTSANPVIPAEKKICTKLIPSHIKSPPQDTKSPYAIYLSRTTLRPGESTAVQICSSKHKIMEFYVQGRQMAGDGELQGTFMPEDEFDSTVLVESCGGKPNLIQQADSTNKMEHVKFKWIAPSKPGVYFLLATVVENDDTVWVRQPSMKIRVVDEEISS